MGLLMGTSLGLLAAHLSGLVEQAVLMLVDFQAALPSMILALAVLAFFGDSLPILVGLMSFYGWERHARVARGLALAAGAQNYVTAIRGLGAGPWRTYLSHVLPNIAATLVVSATLAFPEVTLLESGLSFLGLGVQPPMSSLGNMVGFGRNYIETAPWILIAPSIVICVYDFGDQYCWGRFAGSAGPDDVTDMNEVRGTTETTRRAITGQRCHARYFGRVGSGITGQSAQSRLHVRNRRLVDIGPDQIISRLFSTHNHFRETRQPRRQAVRDPPGCSAGACDTHQKTQPDERTSIPR